MPKDKPDGGGRPPVGRPVNFRASADLIGRLDRTAEILELDTSSLIRLILAENLAVYEKRAEQILRDRSLSDDTNCNAE